MRIQWASVLTASRVFDNDRFAVLVCSGLDFPVHENVDAQVIWNLAQRVFIPELARLGTGDLSLS